MHHITGDQADAVLMAIGDGEAKLIREDIHRFADQEAHVEFWRVGDAVVRRDYMASDPEDSHMDTMSGEDVAQWLGQPHFDK